MFLPYSQHTHTLTHPNAHLLVGRKPKFSFGNRKLPKRQ
jgi:hypothetical protein